MDLMLRIPPLVSQPGTLNYQTAKEQLLFSTVSLSHPYLGIFVLFRGGMIRRNGPAVWRIITMIRRYSLREEKRKALSKI